MESTFLLSQTNTHAMLLSTSWTPSQQQKSYPAWTRYSPNLVCQSPTKRTTAHHSTATNSKPMSPSPDSDTGEWHPYGPGQCWNRTLHAHCKKKSIKTALNKGRSWKQELFKFLLDYRTTPHCTTGVPPANILFGRAIKNRLPHLITPIVEDPSIRERDTKAKRTIKQYADRKAYAKPNDLRVGDTVIVKSDHTSKALTLYQPNPMTIIKKKGSMITATHKGNQTTRNSSFFKNIPKPKTNSTHNLLDYSLCKDESYTHATTPSEPKDNQAQHTPLNRRRSGRTKRPPKRFDH